MTFEQSLERGENHAYIWGKNILGRGSCQCCWSRGSKGEHKEMKTEVMEVGRHERHQKDCRLYLRKSLSQELVWSDNVFNATPLLLC